MISGRGLNDIDRVLEGRIPAVAAVHGLIRRSANGAVSAAANEATVQAALTAVLAFAQGHRGLLIENKGLAIAIHYRRAPAEAQAARQFAADLAAAHGLAVQNGDMVVELRPPGATKADAVEAFADEAPFAGHKPVFLGDDLTDEAGFHAADRLGGFGVVIGPRRPTVARYALAGVAEAQAWLWRSIEGRP